MIIGSEFPQDHWGFLNVVDKRVLDLGCGRMWDIRPTTPEFFLNNGAKMVVGVEMWPNEEKWFDENVIDGRLVVHTDTIDSTEKILKYLANKPQVIKCDIEGAELYLEPLTKNDFVSVEEMAIEYHSAAMKSMIENKYNDWGFESLKVIYINGFDFTEQGVIFLKK